MRRSQMCGGWGSHAAAVVLLTIAVIFETKAQSLVTSDGCGEDKGCFQDPVGCETSACDVLITWEANGAGDATNFGILGHVESDEDYVAMGFSYNQAMDNADVWACLRLDTSDVVLDHSHNFGYTNLQLSTNGSGNFESAVNDGAIECTFTRLNKMEGEEATFFDLYASEYYLLVPRGPRLDVVPPKLSKHVRSPLVSDSTVNFTDVETSGGGSSSPAYHKTHGSLMLFGWVGCASVAIVMARYFKTVWPNSSLLGQKVWFTFHRTLMIINLLCFCTAFVVIFIGVGGWVFYESTSDLPFVHATIGCIVVALGITNPIMAFFRPHPKTPKRPIFNWCHWAVGTSAHLLAVVNIFLGMDIYGMPSYSLWIFAGWLCFHFIFEIFMEILNCGLVKSEEYTSYKIYIRMTKTSTIGEMKGTDNGDPGDIKMTESRTDGCGVPPDSSTEALDRGSPNSALEAKIKLTALCTYLVVTIGIMTYLIVEVCLQ